MPNAKRRRSARRRRTVAATSLSLTLVRTPSLSLLHILHALELENFLFGAVQAGYDEVMSEARKRGIVRR